MYLYLVRCGEAAREDAQENARAWLTADKLRGVTFDHCYAENGWRARETAEICLTGRMLDPETVAETSTQAVRERLRMIAGKGEDTLLVAQDALLSRTLRLLGLENEPCTALRSGCYSVVQLSGGRASVQAVNL